MQGRTDAERLLERLQTQQAIKSKPLIRKRGAVTVPRKKIALKQKRTAKRAARKVSSKKEWRAEAWGSLKVTISNDPNFKPTVPLPVMKPEKQKLVRSQTAQAEIDAQQSKTTKLVKKDFLEMLRADE